MPYLSGITIYPVKSLDGLGLTEATVLPNGALMHDRRWRLVDDEGAVVNAKKNARFHAIRSSFQIEGIYGSGGFQDGVNKVTLSLDECISGDVSSLGQEVFPLVPGRDGPCEWLSEALATNVFLQERFEGGFPDDRDAPGPTVVSQESLNEVARWFDWTVEEARRRFRMNLELMREETDSDLQSNQCNDDNCLEKEAFWEDYLASPFHGGNLNQEKNCEKIPSWLDSPPPQSLRFSIGSVHFHGTSVCQRCNVPSRHSCTGDTTAYFRDAFEARRRQAVARGVDPSTWRNFFMLGVNTSTVGSEASLAIGDRLHVIPR